MIGAIIIIIYLFICPLIHHWPVLFLMQLLLLLLLLIPVTGYFIDDQEYSFIHSFTISVRRKKVNVVDGFGVGGDVVVVDFLNNYKLKLVN